MYQKAETEAASINQQADHMGQAQESQQTYQNALEAAREMQAELRASDLFYRATQMENMAQLDFKRRYYLEAANDYDEATERMKEAITRAREVRESMEESRNAIEVARQSLLGKYPELQQNETLASQLESEGKWDEAAAAYEKLLSFYDGIKKEEPVIEDLLSRFEAALNNGDVLEFVEVWPEPSNEEDRKIHDQFSSTLKFEDNATFEINQKKIRYGDLLSWRRDLEISNIQVSYRIEVDGLILGNTAQALIIERNLWELQDQPAIENSYERVYYLRREKNSWKIETIKVPSGR